jgi:hypothetical protein
MRIVSPFRRTLVCALALLAAACTAPEHRSVVPPPYRFLECDEPPGESVAIAVVEAGGDVLEVRGHSFRLPPGAVAGSERFEMHDRRTRNVGVDIRPHGYQFGVDSTTITLSYARCGELPADFRPFIVEVRPGTTIPVGEPLQSFVDTEARTVTARILHLSGYLVGSN